MIYTNSEGVKYYLHSREIILGRNKIKARSYYFSREKGEHYLSELPIKYTVIETHSKLPMVKKK